MNARVFAADGTAKGEMALPAIFDSPVNRALLHQAVVMYLANARQGTSNTKNRAHVRGGGRKPWRQKGTGRARQGSIRAPQWRKGGIVFGPHPRDFRQDLPAKARRAALVSALAQKALDGDVVVVEGLHEPEKPKTRPMVELFGKIGAAKTLLITAEHAPLTYLSVRNIQGAGVTASRDLNARDVLAHGTLVVTKDALGLIEEALS